MKSSSEKYEAIREKLDTLGILLELFKKLQAIVEQCHSETHFNLA